MERKRTEAPVRVIQSTSTYTTLQFRKPITYHTRGSSRVLQVLRMITEALLVPKAGATFSDREIDINDNLRDDEILVEMKASSVRSYSAQDNLRLRTI
jgi:hypothetical protein